MKKKSIKIFLYVFIIFFSIIIVILINNLKDSSSTVHIDFEKGISEGGIGNGFRSIDTGAIIDRGQLLKKEGDYVNGIVCFEQNLEGTQNYLMVVMIDYHQQAFESEDRQYMTYPFSLTDNEAINIPIHVKIEKAEAEELTYFIIREPDVKTLSISNDVEWTKFFLTKDIFTWQLSLVQERKNTCVFEKEIEQMERLLPAHAELVKDFQDITVKPECVSGENIQLIVGGTQEEEITYVVTAFLNWQQVPFSNGDMQKYIKVPMGKSIYFDYQLPEVTEATPFQFVVFPYPYADAGVQRIPPFTSFRTIILPKKE